MQNLCKFTGLFQNYTAIYHSYRNSNVSIIHKNYHQLLGKTVHQVVRIVHQADRCSRSIQLDQTIVYVCCLSQGQAQSHSVCHHTLAYLPLQSHHLIPMQDEAQTPVHNIPVCFIIVCELRLHMHGRKIK